LFGWVVSMRTIGRVDCIKTVASWESCPLAKSGNDVVAAGDERKDNVPQLLWKTTDTHRFPRYSERSTLMNSEPNKKATVTMITTTE